MAEVSPVDLGLLARQAAQAQIGLCRPAWPMTGNKVTEVIRTAAIAALAHHDEQTARRQFGNFSSVARMNGRYGSICDRRAGEPCFGRPACDNTRTTVSWCTRNCRAMVPTRHFSTW